MRGTRLIGTIAAGLLVAAIAPDARALEFPATFSGLRQLSYTTVNTGSLPVSTCGTEAALDITLAGDGSLSYAYEQVAVSVDQRSGQCSIRSTGKTVSVVGSHDRQGSFTVVFGSASGFTLTGRYDDTHITASWRPLPYPVETFDLPFMGHRIGIEPDPSNGFDFHLQILQNKGFKIIVQDPQGRDHLDFSTLRILVGGSDTQPGVDTTGHALAKLRDGVVRMRDESPDSRTRVFTILPDPQRLMQGQDIFAIPFNGDWRIELRICDKAGHCFGKTYKVYFGPFVTAPKVFNVVDLRCTTPSEPFVVLQSVTIGNVGIDAPGSGIYVGLSNASSGTWTLYQDALGDGSAPLAWWQGQVRPFIDSLPLASGFLATYGLQRLPDWIGIPTGSGAPYLRKLPFPDGDFKFLLAAVDGATGAYRLEEHSVRMCDR